MGVTAKFSQADVARMIEVKLQRIDTAIMSRLQLVGEQFVRDARTKISADALYRAKMRAIKKVPGESKVKITASTPGYDDDTDNLRTSTGFRIIKNGRVVMENFEGGGEGEETGKRFAKEIAANYPIGYALIVVAGMEYAAAVESLGYDVLTGSSFRASRDLKKALNNLRRSLSNG